MGLKEGKWYRSSSVWSYIQSYKNRYLYSKCRAILLIQKRYLKPVSKLKSILITHEIQKFGI